MAPNSTAKELSVAEDGKEGKQQRRSNLTLTWINLEDGIKEERDIQLNEHMTNFIAPPATRTSQFCRLVQCGHCI